MICNACDTGVYLTLLGGTDPEHAENGWYERYRCDQCGRTGEYHVLEVGPHTETWYSGCLGSEFNES